MGEVLKKYKFQPYIEKRHQLFKSVFEAATAFLKPSHRIEAFMFVCFIVLTLNALIERGLRLAMVDKGICHCLCILKIENASARQQPE